MGNSDSNNGPKMVFASLARLALSHGLSRLGALALYRAQVRYLERKLGIQTESILLVREYGFYNEELRDYVPTDYRHLRKALKLLDLSSCDVFLDVGCGLGRAVVYAAHFYSPHRVIGIDITPQFIAIARENVKRALARLQCKALELQIADAGEYEIPDDVTIIYLYNPFAGELLKRVFRNIRASWLRSPRKLRLACVYPLRSAFAYELMKQQWLVPTHHSALDDGIQFRICAVNERLQDEIDDR